jgi:hypothetical protein
MKISYKIILCESMIFIGYFILCQSRLIFWNEKKLWKQQNIQLKIYHLGRQYKHYSFFTFIVFLGRLIVLKF